jgi:hypothetical protein
MHGMAVGSYVLVCHISDAACPLLKAITRETGAGSLLRTAGIGFLLGKWQARQINSRAEKPQCGLLA